MWWDVFDCDKNLLHCCSFCPAIFVSFASLFWWGTITESLVIWKPVRNLSMFYIKPHTSFPVKLLSSWAFGIMEVIVSCIDAGVRTVISICSRIIHDKEVPRRKYQSPPSPETHPFIFPAWIIFLLQTFDVQARIMLSSSSCPNSSPSTSQGNTLHHQMLHSSTKICEAVRRFIITQYFDNILELNEVLSVNVLFI